MLICLQRIPFLKVYSALLITFCFLFPFLPNLAVPVVIIYGLFWLLESRFRERFLTLKRERFRLWLIFPSIFYVLHLIGMIYSKNTDFGLFDIQIKLSLLIFPLFFAVSSKELFSMQNIYKYFMAFIFGSLVYAWSVLSLSTFEYISLSDYPSKMFFYAYLSKGMHPSYAALYAVINIAFCFYLYKYYNSHKILFVFFAILLFIFVILLSSKAGLISLFFCLLFCFFQWIYRFKRKTIILFSTICLFVLFLSFQLVKNIPAIYERYTKIIPALKGSEVGDASTNVRIKLWNTAVDLIPQYFWIGTGTGDVKDVFIGEYHRQKDEVLMRENLNPHSQFLQSFLALGILGFLSLVAFLVVAPVYVGIKNKYPLLLLFAAMAIINNLVESMIEVQGGVMFFAFFYCLLIMHSFVYKQNENSKRLN